MAAFTFKDIFLVEAVRGWVDLRAISLVGRVMPPKYKNTIGNRTPAYSEVPLSTAPARAPLGL